jgi:putative DNA primase/helicase
MIHLPDLEAAAAAREFERQNGADANEPTSHHLTELGNAGRFVEMHGANVRYCPAFRAWLCWDGRRWAQDETGEVVRLARETVRSIYSEATHCGSESGRVAIATHAKRSERAAAIAAMLKLAETEPSVPILPARLDEDAFLLNVRNGTVNLRTGELLPHRRGDYITRLAPVEYDPRVFSARWDQFLAEVFEPHPDVPDFVQRAVGYSLTGSTVEECLFLLYGAGRNGKGVLLRTLGAMLGEYASTADFDAFTARRDLGGPRDDIAIMRGARFVQAQESREGAAFAESLIKWLTGGDRVRARRLYENSIEFDPTFKLWLASNHRPTIRGGDPAIWSRIRLLPFDVSFEGREDRGLKERLMGELTGILSWAVEGCLRWQSEGLAPVEAVRSATDEYRAEQDSLGRFVTECCFRGEAYRARAKDLYRAYRQWAEDGGEHSMTQTAFGRRLAALGFAKRDDARGVIYEGLGLRAEP